MLEILNNRTEHTHENEQFRRVVEILENAFEKLGYSGLLIGNAFNEEYHRFRADAILYYSNGIVIIDFKDYQGKIKLPPNENEFHTTKWYNESLKDNSRLEIKAGSRFVNPFRQLVSYRNAFREIIENNKYICDINPARVCILNIFSGPIEVENEIPRNLPYYKLVQESDLAKFIYDFSSENQFSKENAEILKSIFPAEEYVKDFHFSVEKKIENRIIHIENDVEENIVDFLKEEKGGILVLESMDAKDRDTWLEYIQKEAINYHIPQIEQWSHSKRISKKIRERCGIDTEGVYNVIYGGTDIKNDFLEDNEKGDENLQEIIPLKSDKDIDKKSLIIITEAHLISRSLNQSELLRFGSGRLLEDIIRFINPETDRKIVFIGDPYFLTFGKNEDSALNLETLSELYDAEKIKHYRKSAEKNLNEKGRNTLRINLVNSIENRIFNNLDYDFDENSLIEIHKDNAETLFQNWFSVPFDREPSKAVLFYSKKDCQKSNLWIKKNILKNGEKLSAGDLLIVNNNVIIADETGLQIPKRIVNGTFFTILEVKETKQEIIKIHQSELPIILSFTKIRVKCLSIESCPETDVWMLDNYFNNEEELSKNEQIAFRVLVNQKINEERKKQKFIKSREFQQLLHDENYEKLSEQEQKNIRENIDDLRKLTKEQREIAKMYRKEYDKNIFNHIRNTDPLVNAVYLKYAWAITVHKAIGSDYQEIIIKGHRKENDGITNDDYFRWLYSGITAGQKINIIMPKRITPMMNCIFEDNSEKGISVKEKSLLIFENNLINNHLKEKFSIENKNVLGVIEIMSKRLEQNGYILHDIQKKSEYLTKVFYSVPDNETQNLIINIDNKGGKDDFAVGNIRIEKLNNADENLVKQSIDDCWAMQKTPKELPTDFRKEIYSRWVNDFEKYQISLDIIENHNNQDIFRANGDNEKVIFKVWYGTSEQNHTKGFFNKIEILEKTSDNIVEKIKELIF